MDLDDQWAVLEPVLAPTRRADGRGRPWQDARGVLNGVPSASPGEVTLVETTLDDRFLADFPDRLIGDKAHVQRPLGHGLDDQVGHRADCAAPIEPPAPGDSRWPARPPSQAAVEDRATLRVIPQLPPARGALGTKAQN